MSIVNKLIIKYKTMGLPAKASVWYTLCNVLQKGIAFLVVPIYTRVLTKGEYGLYSTFQSWKDIIIIFATLNLYCGVFTKAMVDLNPKERDGYTSCMQGLTTLVSALLFILYFPLRSSINSFLEMDTFTICLMFGYFIFYPSILFWSVRQRVEYRYIKMVVITLVISVLVPSVSLLLLYTTGLREKSVIWGYLFVNIFFGLLFYVYNFWRGKTFFSKNYWVKALKFNIPLIPHYLALIVLGQSDRIMIQKMVGEDEVALYSLAYQISMLMTILISGIDSALVPWEYESFKNKQFKKVSSVCTKIAFAVGILIVVAVLISPELVYILGGNKYSESIWIIPAVSISIFFMYIYGLFSSIEFYYGNTKFVMIASSLAALLNIGLNYFFIKMYGYMAAAYTTLICYVFLAIIHYVFAIIVKNKNGVKEKIYDFKILSILSLIFLSTLPFCLLLYKYPIGRYIFITVFLVVILICRRSFLNLFRKIKGKENEKN